jgi:hypothetical protein
LSGRFDAGRPLCAFARRLRRGIGFASAADGFCFGDQLIAARLLHPEALLFSGGARCNG